MKFLYSHRTQSADGQYAHIRGLTEAMRARGHAVVITGPDGRKETASKPYASGGASTLKKMLPGAAYELAELAYSYPSFWLLRQLYKAEQPEVIYQRYNLFYYPGAWLRRSHDTPLLLEVNAPLADERAAHGNLALKKLAQKSEAAIWRSADMVLPVSQVLAERVIAVGVPEEKIRVIHNGVGPEFLTSHAPNSIRQKLNLQDKTVLGFTGFVRDWHGVDKIINALSLLKREDLHLLIVGDGPAREELETLAASLGVSEKVTFTGVVQRESLPDYIAAFDIALQPAVTDYASPLKIFEYMALGKPIIAPSSKNIREILTHGVDAMLFDPISPEAFSFSLRDLVDHEDLRNQLGSSARSKLIREDYTWAGNARRVEEIAEQLREKRS